MNIINQTLEQELSAWMASAFSSIYPDADLGDINTQVAPARKEEFGDFQCDAAMKMAKALKTAPRQVAQAVLDYAPRPACIDRMEIAGPGFINIFISDAWLAKRIEDTTTDERLGVPETGNGKTVVLDYSSPNVAKPMHIGHIRSTVIGNALDRLHRFLGFKVIADNHLGDWGTQFGLMLLGYKRLVNEEALHIDPVGELERIYRESYEKSQADEDWLAEARGELLKLQQGDEDNLALWQNFITWSKLEFNKIYHRLGVSFDFERGESYYNTMLQGVMDKLESLGLSEQSEGATVVRLDDENLPLSIVRKSDGAFNYTTTDLATVQCRVMDFHPDAIVYVTDERQQLHFKQVFSICKKMGVTTRLEHVWFGLMRLPEGTFSTRQGNVIKLELLLDEAVRRAYELVATSDNDIPEDTKQAVAEAVGIGAVKYADLSQNPQSLVTFSWDKALSLEGNSAPYLQYAYARIASVRDKYTAQFPDKDFLACPIKLAEPIERKLALRLVRFGDAVISATQNYRPNYLADYLYDLAQLYSNFYQNVPFLKAEEGVRESRIRLCDMVAKTLRKGLDLLGINTPDRI
ncbi:MAG: arginine--tRNA ligase [Spartobacteria bacterium]|nr:arginine--tRNA ligase [Spartobacteria bacterium]